MILLKCVEAIDFFVDQLTYFLVVEGVILVLLVVVHSGAVQKFQGKFLAARFLKFRLSDSVEDLRI